jgi:SAM-dependent methyltransferase
MPPRRAGAPRLIEWTGERLVPWAADAPTVYEHFHRYLWAQPLVAGRRVLDLASGEGFGAALLADRAQSVTGVDIDERTVEHSRLNYVAPNLDFRVGSASDLSAFADGAFDVVVAFEMIEHVTDHDTVLAEAARVLAPGGLLIMSTPERQAYSDDRDYVNRFHERELTLEEFTGLLRSRFSNLARFAQRTVAGSRIEDLDPAPAGGHLAVRIERVGDEWRPAGPPAPLYIVAVASDGELPELPADSSLLDYGLGLIDDLEADRARLEREFLAERERLIAELLERTGEMDAAHARAQRAEDEARRVQESVAWQLLERIRRTVYAVIGDDSAVGRGLRRAMHRLYRAIR